MKRPINYYFLIFALLLIAFGILFLANLSAPASLQIFGNTNYYLFHQLFSLAIGITLALIVFKIPLHILKKAAPFLLVINLLLLIVVFLPVIGTKFWGARRWISIGNNTFQPSEFFKITAVLYLSAWLSKKFSANQKGGWLNMAKVSSRDFIKIFLPFLLLLVIISVILLFQKDVSTLGIITISLLAVYFAAGTPFWHTILAVLIEVGAGLLAIRIEPYRVQRFLTFLHPETDPLGRGFQLKQALLALGSGGIFGNGWGMSTQKFGFLPQAMSDSIFAVLGEETGIVGCLILLVLFLLFFWQGIKISMQSTDRFSKMAATGICTWIIMQAFMNIASSIGIWPLSGIPLPFFSYGGSHIIAEMIGVGILLNISKNG